MGVVLLVAAAACSPTAEPVTIAYAATGADRVEVSYALDGETVTEVVDTPWELELEVQGSYRLALITRNLEDRGSVSCTIVADEVADQPIQTVGEAAAECRASVERRGGGAETSAFTTTREFEDEGEGESGEDDAGEGDAEVATEALIPVDDSIGNIEVTGTHIVIGHGSGITTIDLRSAETAQTDLPGRAASPYRAVRDDDGTLYATSCRDDVLLAMAPDDADPRVLAEFRTGQCPRGLWLVDGVLWVESSLNDQLVRVDPATGEEISTTRLPGRPVDAALFEDLVYVTTVGGSQLLVLDPADGQVIDRVTMSQADGDLAVVGDHLAVTTADEPVIQLVRDRQRTIRHEGTGIVETDEGQVLLQQDDQVTALDPSTLELADPVLTGVEGTLVAAGPDRLFLLTDAGVLPIGLSPRDPG